MNLKPLAWDTETALIRPAQLAPPLVCVTWQRPGLDARIETHSYARPLLESWLRDPTTLLIGHFVAYDMAVICAEFPELVPLVFAAYRARRVTCTKKRQQLLDIAGGVFRGRVGEKGRWITHEYTLDALSRRHLSRPMQKDGWRLEYANFRDVPLRDWPTRAAELQARARARRAELPTLSTVEKEDPRHNEIKNLDAIIADVPEGVIRYPLDDAITTLDVWQAQEKHADQYLRDQYRQAYADFVLYLSSAWGLRTNAAGVEALRAELTEAHGELESELRAIGMVREDGTRNMRAVKDAMIVACRDLGLSVRRTDAHLKCELGDACEEHISLDSDACDAVVNAATTQSAVANPVDVLDAEAVESPFVAYAEFTAITKTLSNDVKMLEGGVVYPVHTRYDIAETGRTTSSKPALQNINAGRVKNARSLAQRLRKGIRQAFIPRHGKVFIQSDFPQLELYTLAQTCYTWLGYSKLGDMLNAGIDPHMAFASKIGGFSYDEGEANKKRDDVYRCRQTAKAFNFGKPGGMGDKKFRVSAWKMYGVELSESQCKDYTMQWHETFPEMRAHFARVNAMFGQDTQRVSIETLFTERHRGGTTYCGACNNGFQALGADCAKAALILVSEAEYCDTLSPLYGSRSPLFVHDEIVAETDDGPNVHDAAFELARLMTVGANQFLPDVPILPSRMEPTAMRVWSKDAKQVFDANGRLIPWSTEEKAA